MERTFGVKDFLLFTVLALLIVLVVLAMVQFDRQWGEIQSVRRKLDDQNVDLQNIQRAIGRVGSSSVVAAPSTTPTSDVPPAQARLLAARSKPGYAEGDWLVYGFQSKIAALTPFLGGDAYSAEVLNNIQEPLLSRDPVTLKLQGLLAESWTVDDTTAAWKAYADRRRTTPLTEAEVRGMADFPKDAPAAQQKTYLDARIKQGRTDEDVGREADCPPAATVTFKLRPNATFSDGVPVTAADVAFTFAFIQNPEINAPRERSTLTSVKSVTALPDGRVAFVFRTPFFQAVDLAGGLPVLPQHFYEKFKPADYNRSTGLLLGSGPYRLESPETWKPGTPIELVRNARYWGEQPAFTKIVYREFTNSVAIETSFRNGEIDYLPCPPERFLKLTKDDDILKRTQHFEYQNTVGGYRYIAWNQLREGKATKFADVRVRRALTLLVDQKRVISDVMLNLAAPATGPFNPSSKQYDASLKPYAYDPDQATKLLAEAGWTDAGSGVLTNAAGEPFEFTLTYPSGSPNYDKQALLLRDLFAKAKIRLKTDPQEFSVFGDRLKTRQFDAISLGWMAGLETDIFQMFHSSQMADGGDDFMGYKNPELDATIDQARRTLDEPARMALWNKAHRILYEDQPYTFLFFPKTLVFADKRLANVQQVPIGLNSDTEWFVPKADQKYTR